MTRPLSFTPQLRSSRHSGFTLIELLVVIAILAILASLLVATLGSVQRKARTSEALSNLRQIGVTSSLYSTENDGRLLTPNSPGGIWIEQLWPYAYPNTEYPGLSAADAADKLAGTIFHTPNVEKNSGKVTRSFGMNYLPALRVDNKVEPRRLSYFEQPSITCIVADTTNSSALSSKQINFRNNGMAAVLYLDGHAGTVVPEDLPEGNTGVFWKGE